MKRRELLAGLLPVAVAPPAWAQQPGKMYRIAFFRQTDPVSAMTEHGGNPFVRALFAELRRLGYEEGRNLTVERYSGGGQPDTYRRMASQIVASRPDLILVFGNLTTGWFADAAAGQIPIVCATGDPIKAGLTNSLSRPSRNVTGVVGDAGEIIVKGVELLREIYPRLMHVAMLTPRYFWEADGSPGPNAARKWAQQAGFRLTCLCYATPVQEAAYQQVFAELDHDRPDVIFVYGGPDQSSFRELIVTLINAARVPALYPDRTYAELGGLMSYGADFAALYRELARQISLILSGRPVSEVPFNQTSRWEIVINLKTAKALGLTIPPAILARADEVIE